MHSFWSFHSATKTFLNILLKEHRNYSSKIKENIYCKYLYINANIYYPKYNNKRIIFIYYPFINKINVPCYKASNCENGYKDDLCPSDHTTATA